MPGVMLYVSGGVVGFLAGFIIGSVGVGGVVVVPLLIALPAVLGGPVDVFDGVRAALFSYCFTGIVGTTSYASQGSVRWSPSLYVVLGAAPSAAVASAVMGSLGAATVLFGLYSIMILSSIVSFRRAWSQRRAPDLLITDMPKHPEESESGSVEDVGQSDAEKGILAPREEEEETKGSQEHQEDGVGDHELRQKLTLPLNVLVKSLEEEGEDRRIRRSSGDAAEAVPEPALVADDGRTNGVRVLVGVITGFLSALSGTAGPVVLLPLTLGLKWDILEALGAAQMVQLPIGLAATIANAATSGVPWYLGLSIGLGAMPAVVLGTKVAHRIPRNELTLLLSCLLFCAGLALMIRGAVAVT